MFKDISAYNLSLVPALLSLVILSLAITNYYQTVNRYIDVEYSRIQRALIRSTKAVAAIDYSFAAFKEKRSDLFLKHSRIVEDGLCRMWPIDALLTGQQGTMVASPLKELNYMMVGSPEMCDPQNPLYRRASQQVAMAPMLSFLHDFDSYLFGVHFIDREGYVFSSPDTLSKNITKQLLDTIRARSYWIEAAKSEPQISLVGPSTSRIITKRILSLVVPFFFKEQYQGMISLDIDAPKLLQNSQVLASNIRIINTRDETIPFSARRVHKVELPEVQTHHALYYQIDWGSEVQRFFALEKYSLIVIAFIYMLSVIVLFYVNSNMERSHLKRWRLRIR
ncbi:PDC sensor domain-containing protein [Vibrio olivae]